MPLHYLHLRDHVDEILDPEGVELNEDAVPEHALRAARDCMAEDVKAGRLDLRFRIDVHDATGACVHSLPFTRALEIVPPE